jgi:hypothetical protein
MPAFNSTGVPTAQDMARRIAEQTNGSYTWKQGIVWTNSRGGRHRDPQDHIQYETRDDLDSAWEWCLQRGKQVHYYDSLRTLQTAIRIGRYLIERANTWSQRLGHNYLLSVRTVKALQNSLMSVQKITDQQAAALRDLAQTRTANTLEKLKIIIDILQSKNTTDIKTAIDLTPLIDPRDKEKLDKIIDDAKNLPPEQLDEDLKKKLGAAALAAGIGLGGLGYKYYGNQPQQLSEPEHTQELQRLANKKDDRQTVHSVAFIKKLKQISQELQVEPADLIRVMYLETRGTLNPAITNKIGATGLIQFMPNTAKALGTSTEQLRNMSAVDQLDYVLKYFKIKKLPPGSTASDIYLSTFMPAAITHRVSDDFILGARRAYNIPVFKHIAANKLNRGSVWDQNPVFKEASGAKKRGFFTVGDVRHVFDSRVVPDNILSLYK